MSSKSFSLFLPILKSKYELNFEKKKNGTLAAREIFCTQKKKNKLTSLSLFGSSSLVAVTLLLLLLLLRVIFSFSESEIFRETA